LWKPEAFSPRAYVRRALIVTLVYTVSELLGLREYTTFLSGTTASTSQSWQMVAALGCLHLVLYFAFVLLVPVWLIAAGLLAAWNRVKRPISQPAAGRPD